MVGRRALLARRLYRAVSQNARGHVVGHVKRLDGADAGDPDVRIYTTSAAQPWHVDDADLVALLCLRKAKANDGGSGGIGGGGGNKSKSNSGEGDVFDDFSRGDGDESDRSDESVVVVDDDEEKRGERNNGEGDFAAVSGAGGRVNNSSSSNSSKSASGGLSRWASSLSVYNKILRERPDLVRELSKPFAFDKRGEVAPGTLPYLEVPVLSVHGGVLTFFYNDEYARSAQRHAGAPPLTPAMEEALRAVTEAAESPELHLEWDLEPGDIQVMREGKKGRGLVFISLSRSLSFHSFFFSEPYKTHETHTEKLSKLTKHTRKHSHKHKAHATNQTKKKQLIWNWSQLHTRTAYDDPPAFGERRHLLRLWLEAHGARHPLPPAFPREAHEGIRSADGVLRAPLDAE